MGFQTKLIIDQKNILQIFKNFNPLAFHILFRSCLCILWIDPPWKSRIDWWICLEFKSSKGAFKNYVDKIFLPIINHLPNLCWHLWRNTFTEIRKIYIPLTFQVPPITNLSCQHSLWMRPNTNMYMNKKLRAIAIFYHVCYLFSIYYLGILLLLSLEEPLMKRMLKEKGRKKDFEEG